MAELVTGSEVKITEGRKVVQHYIVKKLTIASNTKRLDFVNEILSNEDLPESEKGQLCNCASLCCVLTDGEGKFLYEGEKPYMKMYEEMDPEIFVLLMQEYYDLNPIESKLKAKKKRF